MWKIIAKSAAIDKKITQLGIRVDGRTRISRGDKEKAILMASYFGSVVSLPYGTKKVDEVIENPLSWVANEVHGIVEGRNNKEYFLELINWVEA